MTNTTVQFLIPYVISLALALLSAALAYAVKELRAHFTAPQLAATLSIAETVVKATEQIAPTLSLRGENKLNEALARAKELGATYGINLDDPQWATAIEAAVRELKSAGKELTTPPPQSAPPALSALPPSLTVVNSPGPAIK